MLRLLRFTIGLIVILTLALVTVRMIARLAELPFPLNAFNQSANCQLPCWHGISPDDTMSLADASRLLNADPALSAFTAPRAAGQGMVWMVNNRPGAQIILDYTGTGATAKVRQITLRGLLPAGQVVAAVGNLNEIRSLPTCTWKVFIFPKKPSSTIIAIRLPMLIAQGNDELNLSLTVGDERAGKIHSLQGFLTLSRATGGIDACT